MTAADIGRAEEAYKTGRFKQLADARMIDTSALKVQPTAGKQSEALLEKYKSRQEKSIEFHTQVGDIAKRGAEATAARDRGAGITEEKRAYREALERAEANAQVGTVKTTLTEPAGEQPKSAALDEYGDAFGRPV